MNNIIVIANQKGGVGKSTTALSVGAGISQRGKLVLMVDLDPQGNLSYTMRADPDKPTSYDLLMKEATTDEAIQVTPLGHLIAAHSRLASADIQLTSTGKEYLLREVLQPIAGRYDYIIIDTPPALGILTVNALTAAGQLIIPAQADTYSLQGIGQLYSTVQAIRKYCNPELSITGILLTRHNNRTILSRDLSDMMSDTALQLETKVFETAIRENVSVKEAQTRRSDIFSYAPKSNAAADYGSLIDEIIREG